MKIKIESLLMSLFRKLGVEATAWSLRRLYCPVNKKDLVLEVGSGGNPYFRANVLCDAYLETNERYFEPLIYDRPTVLAFTEKLPFKDNSFDFVIASHVLEHSVDPDNFLKEIQRVGKAGYIETPNTLFERICSYPMHRLEVIEKKDELIIYKKTAPSEDKYLNELSSQKLGIIFSKLVSKYPFNFHVRYYWSKECGGIKYRIVNPDYKFNWKALQKEKKNQKSKSIKNKIRKKIIFLLRKIFSQNKRNKQINIINYLKCLNCGNGTLEKRGSVVFCQRCNYEYKIVNKNIIDFTN